VRHEIPTARAESGACLEVSTEQQRHSAHRLQRVELSRNLRRRADRDRKTADFFLLDVLRQMSPLGRIARCVITQHARPYYLHGSRARLATTGAGYRFRHAANYRRAYEISASPKIERSRR